MRDPVLVSVIIPTYNQAQYLKEAIESVLKQTFKNTEVIIIDDGSTDNTKEIIKLFSDSRIIYIWQENKGAAAARNTGIKKAQGKYIAFLDADDFWLPKKLEKQFDFMEKNPEMGLLGTGCYEINDKGEIITTKIFPTENKILQKDLIKYNPFIQSSVIIKKEVFDRVGLYNEKFQESEDYELWLRIAKDYKIANLAEPLIVKRYSSKSISPNKDKKQLLFALRAKKEAILNGQYPKWCYIYILRSYLFFKMPFFIRKFIRRYLKKIKVYD